jgi:hypothetical protein
MNHSQNTAVTFGWRHGAETAEVIHGQEVPILTQRAAFSKMLHSRENADFARVEIWEKASGRTLYRDFAPSGSAPVPPTIQPPVRENSKKGKR